MPGSAWPVGVEEAWSHLRPCLFCALSRFRHGATHVPHCFRSTADIPVSHDSVMLDAGWQVRILQQDMRRGTMTTQMLEGTGTAAYNEDPGTQTFPITPRGPFSWDAM